MATNQDAPFGLKPIGKVGQNRDNQGLSEYDIAASATAIFFNDPVKMKSDGTIEVAGAGGAILGSLGGIFFYRRKHKQAYVRESLKRIKHSD
tara:strand:- start:233 stop:508 length:276 start_codon:yes stop_codon:yes gene_type:complete